MSKGNAGFGLFGGGDIRFEDGKVFLTNRGFDPIPFNEDTVSSVINAEKIIENGAESYKFEVFYTRVFLADYLGSEFPPPFWYSTIEGMDREEYEKFLSCLPHVDVDEPRVVDLDGERRIEEEQAKEAAENAKSENRIAWAIAAVIVLIAAAFCLNVCSGSADHEPMNKYDYDMVYGEPEDGQFG